MKLSQRYLSWLRLLTASLIVASALAACAPATPAPTAVPTAASTEITVVDGLGRTVTFAQLPERIVIAGRATTLVADAFYLFPEAAQRLVAFEQRSQSASNFLSVVDPAFGEKTLLEMNAAPEQIAPLQPDVVILKSAMAEKLGTPLEQLGIQVVYVDLETPEQFTRDITALGQLLGNPERAQQILSFYQARLDRLSTATQGLAADQKPRVLVIQYTEEGGEVAFNVPPEGWLQTTIVRLAGGEPVWTEAAEAGGWTIVNFEQIAAWDPDQVYVVSYRGDSHEIADRLQADPNWQALKAAQNDQIFGFAGDFYSWDQPDPRWVLGMLWLYTKVQPELAQAVEIRQELDQFYIELYGLSATTVADKIAPTLYGDIP